MDYEKLAVYCKTVRQNEVFDAIIQTGSQRKASKKLGINKRNVEICVAKVKGYAARQGYSPEHDMNVTVPDGFHLKGTSTLYGDDGVKKLQWVKSNIDHERQLEIMKEAVQAFCDDLPKAKPSPQIPSKNKDLVNQYTITDYHLGMLSWPDETGEDWNTDIAEEMLVDWFRYGITHSPDAHQAIFAQIGDFLHWDGMEAVTPTNKHILDADTRFQHIVRVTIRVFRRVIGLLLEKYPKVHIVMADANHDPASGCWLREMFHSFYSEDRRITVDNSADSYYCFEHGLTGLAYHHGHKRKPGNIDTVIASKFREMFGRTKYVYTHTGHLHHDKVIETNLMKIEQHETLSAKDAYASRGGYMSNRSAKVITYHKEYGEVSRLTITPEMLK